MIHKAARKPTGFTLVELMVVVGIMAMLMAIVIPATQSLRKGNRVSTCAFKLQQIGNAMKAYHFDYGSVPPRYPGYVPPEDPGYPGAFNPTYDPDGDGEVNVGGPGLMALWDGGHLTSRRALHCPSDIDPDHPEYSDPNYADPADNYGHYGSYMRPDPDAATVLYDFNNYKYLSTRGIPFTDPVDPYYKRQLEDPDFYGPGTGSTWYPDDTTVVAWCNYHAEEYFRSGEGQYQVLFWDGSVKTLPASLFDGSRDPADPTYRDAAWKVTPDILEQE